MRSFHSPTTVQQCSLKVFQKPFIREIVYAIDQNNTSSILVKVLQCLFGCYQNNDELNDDSQHLKVHKIVILNNKSIAKFFYLPVIADAGSWSKVKHAIPSQNRFNILNCHKEYEIIWHTCTIAGTFFPLYNFCYILFSLRLFFVFSFTSFDQGSIYSKLLMPAAVNRRKSSSPSSVWRFTTLQSWTIFDEPFPRAT